MSGDSLPLDITEAILLRLPVKSVGRFMCVSKTWNSLIRNPHFVKKHLHQTTSLSPKASNLILLSKNSYYSIDVNQLLPYLNNSDDNIDIPATAKEFITPPGMWGYAYESCNGLVLVEDVKGAIFLLNPTTKEVLEIPGNSFAIPYNKSIVKYGFGYDAHADDYKVVSMSSWHPKKDEHYYDRKCYDTLFVSVYSLRNNSWKKLHNLLGHVIYHILYSNVFINQNLHWLYHPGYSSPTRPLSKLFVFSLANEEFNEIKLPDSVENNTPTAFYNLVDLGGKLGVLLSVMEESYCLCVMEEYGVCESWTKLCVIIGFEWAPRPVCLVEGCNRNTVLIDHDHDVVVYNIDENRSRKMMIEGGPSEFFVKGTYVESLESLKRIFPTTP